MTTSSGNEYNNNNKYEYQQKPRYAILVNDMLNDFIHGNLKFLQKWRVMHSPLVWYRNAE
jgi:hypothetical protein